MICLYDPRDLKHHVEHDYSLHLVKFWTQQIYKVYYRLMRKALILKVTCVKWLTFIGYNWIIVKITALRENVKWGIICFNGQGQMHTCIHVHDCQLVLSWFKRSGEERVTKSDLLSFRLYGPHGFETCMWTCLSCCVLFGSVRSYDSQWKIIKKSSSDFAGEAYKLFNANVEDGVFFSVWKTWKQHVKGSLYHRGRWGIATT